MKQVKTVSAVGHILCHDLTQIIPNEYKGARFRKGHIVTEEDIPVLLSMGKENLYVWERKEGILQAWRKRRSASGREWVLAGMMGNALMVSM